MANEDDWEFRGDCGNLLNVEQVDGAFTFYSDCDQHELIEIPDEKVRELRDWLTAKLEGNDGRN